MGADKQRLGILLEEMIRTLSARQHRPLGEVMGRLSETLGVKPDAVYKWRQGVFVPNVDAVAYLVQVGASEAAMDRRWADEVLALVDHPDRLALLAHLFPSALSEQTPTVVIKHNLPHLQHRKLYGREHEVATVFERLAPQSRDWIIPLTGPGGIGKTALALEVASQLVGTSEQTPIRLLAGSFDAVIYASASRTLLDMRSIADRPVIALQSLEDLYELVPETILPAQLNHEDHRDDHRAQTVMRALRQVGRVLLIIDDLDALSNDQDDPVDGLNDDEMRKVLNFLRDLPANCKAIVTARFHEDLPSPIEVGPLSPAPLERILCDEYEARQTQFQAQLGRPLTESDRKRLVEAAEGNPLAVKWFLWKMMLRKCGAEEATHRDADFNVPLYTFQRNLTAQPLSTFRRGDVRLAHPSASFSAGSHALSPASDDARRDPKQPATTRRASGQLSST